MKSYQVSGVSDRDLQVTPKIHKNKRFSMWVEAENKRNAKRVFAKKALFCYGISPKNIIIFD